MKDILHIKSIRQLHEILKIEKPKHPLISVFTFSLKNGLGFADLKYSMELFQISIKGNCPFIISKYGRNSYDFQECSIIFSSPNQVLEFNNAYKTEDEECWTLVFHPDLIRKSKLGSQIDDYSFFNYSSNEALHLSFDERKMLSEIVGKIVQEYNQNIDAHSQRLILTNLELLLNYCVRYYDRQFYTRTSFNQDLAQQFFEILKVYYEENKQLDFGIPSVKYCAGLMNLSPRYLSDLLKKETGKGAQDHIHRFIIDKAKIELLNSKDSASQIAYKLGFEYPQYFSKMFKDKTNFSPNEYRKDFI
jgi:AraC-like DNA-binding protein